MEKITFANDKVASGFVIGPFSEDTMVCQYTTMIRPRRGIMYGENPLHFSLPVAFAQISLIYLTARFVHFLLKPFRQSMITAQILAGILLGPSLLWHYLPSVKSIFPPEGRVILHIIADMGIILHLFIQTLRMDIKLITQAGKKAALVGLASLLSPTIIGGLTYRLILQAMTLDEAIMDSIPRVVIACSLSAFPVISNLLSDLKLLNSEIGRLATKASVICDFCSIFVFQWMGSILLNRSYRMALESFTCSITFLVTVVFILRPLIIWLAKSNEQGEELDESRFFIIVLTVFLCALISELLGQHYTFGPVLLGIVLPDGPPLGTELENKLDIFGNGLLLPVFCAVSGLNSNFFAMSMGNFNSVIFLVILSTFTGKLIATTLSGLCCGLTVIDAFSLALIMCSKGIIEIAAACNWKDSKEIGDEAFVILIVSMIIVSGVTRPLVSFLYDPSKRYKTSTRRSIHDSTYDSQLRVLVCIHDTDNVHIAINLLKACNPTRHSPVTVFVLHLMELIGRSAAILVPHHPVKHQFSAHTVNAFNQFEHQFEGSAIVQHFTAVAPYKIMHNDVCTVALDKRITMVIVPFHKQWSIDGNVGSVNPSVRYVNQNVIDNAPCSVGVLIDREQKDGNQFIIRTESAYHIAVFLFGGDDDYEALALSSRIADNPSINLTMVLVKHDCFESEKERNIKVLINNFYRPDNKDRIDIKEVEVNNGEEITQVFRSVEDGLDLVIVGRHVDPSSSITFGLTEWSECPEIGVFGDMLSSSDFHFSVLVVVHQRLTPFRTYNIPSKPLSNKRSLSSLKELFDGQDKKTKMHNKSSKKSFNNN